MGKLSGPLECNSGTCLFVPPRHSAILTRMHSSGMHTTCFRGHHQKSVHTLHLEGESLPSFPWREIPSPWRETPLPPPSLPLDGDPLGRRPLTHRETPYPCRETPSLWTDRHLWKHYLPTSSFEGSKYVHWCKYYDNAGALKCQEILELSSNAQWCFYLVSRINGLTNLQGKTCSSEISDL